MVTLAKKLEDGQPALDKVDRYYRGTSPLAYSSDKWRSAFGGRLAKLGTNWVRLFVDVLAERLQVVGFRFPGREDDAGLWPLWQANGGDELAALAILDSLVAGRSYFIVWKGPNGQPKISVESARQVICAHNPGTREVTSAVKVWRENDRAMATLFERDTISKWQSSNRIPEGTPMSATSWIPRDEPMVNPLQRIPVVCLANRGRVLDIDGESELSGGMLALQDLANKLICDLTAGAEAYALPRRWATGLEVEHDPETNQPIEPFGSDFQKLFVGEDPQTKFGEFEAANLEALLKSIEATVQHMSAQASVPSHLSIGQFQGQQISAESIRAAEAPLVMRAKRRQLSFSGAFEEVARLALLVRDGTLPPEADGLETIWSDPSTSSPAQAMDAALKSKDVGVPLEARLEALGYSPQAIARMAEMRRREAMEATAVDLAGLFGGDGGPR